MAVEVCELATTTPWPRVRSRARSSPERCAMRARCGWCAANAQAAPRRAEHLCGGVMAPRLTYVIASAVLVLAEASPVARAQEPTRVQGLVTNDAPAVVRRVRRHRIVR